MMGLSVEYSAKAGQGAQNDSADGRFIHEASATWVSSTSLRDAAGGSDSKPACA